ncbi:MAG: type II toxin-antitoxin system Phd/YefM family antitoxin [Proteobacteria bacterium]|nr:type II toxin-antitoxin system Phd/YefM family antitoxin [Pseudomonadota bacterium]
MAKTLGVSALDARAHFSDLLGRACHGKERIVIRRHNRPVAALVRSRILLCSRLWKRSAMRRSFGTPAGLGQRAGAAAGRWQTWQ